MVNFNATRVLSTLVNPDKIMPVAAIEVAATLGRTYQGYKRGGKEEGRERLREETIGALFWLWGVKVLNKIGDKIGQKLGIKYLDIDVGRDELRAPSLNIPEASRLKTTGYKFGKIIASAVIATALMGFVLPKINHFLTNAQRKAQGLPPIPEAKDKKKKGAEENTQKPSVVSAPVGALGPSLAGVNIENYVASSKTNAQNPSFTGDFSKTAVNLMSQASHNLENKTTWRLMSTDVGMIAGRTLNSRNKFEAMEFLFRDTASVYFYMFATPNLMSLLNKVSGNTHIHPDSLKVAEDYFVKSIGSKKLSPDEFKAKALSRPKNFEKLMSKIKFSDKNVTTLKEFNRATGNAFEVKALSMSKMQPKMNGEYLLSKQQAEYILSNGWGSDPKMLKKAVNAGTYGAALDKKRFVPRKTVEGICTSIDNFSDNLVKYAKSKNIEKIDADLIKKFAKRTTRMNLLFRLSGMAFASFGLAYLIPKLQYKMTEIRTGSKQFPGTADYSDCLNVETMPSKDNKKA